MPVRIAQTLKNHKSKLYSYNSRIERERKAKLRKAVRADGLRTVKPKRGTVVNVEHRLRVPVIVQKGQKRNQTKTK